MKYTPVTVAAAAFLMSLSMSSVAQADQHGGVGGAQAPFAETGHHDWSGVYAGGTMGYGWGQTGASDVDAQLASASDPTARAFLEQLIKSGSDQSIDGLVGGVFAGINWQHDGIVLGLEAGFDIDDVGASTSFDVPINSRVDLSVARDWTAMLGGRIGSTVDRALVFAEGGLAISRATAGFDLTNGAGDTDSYEDSQTQYGYYVGAGADIAVSDHVFVGVKYTFVDLQETTYTFSDGADSVASTGDSHLHLGKVRLGFRF